MTNEINKNHYSIIFNVKSILKKEEMNFVQRYPNLSTITFILIIVSCPTIILYPLVLLKIPINLLLCILAIFFIIILFSSLNYYFFQEGPSFLNNKNKLLHDRNLFKSWQPFIKSSNINFNGITDSWLNYQKSLINVNIEFGLILYKKDVIARKWLEKQISKINKGELFYYQARFLIAGIGGSTNLNLALESAKKAIDLSELRAYSLIGYIYSLPESELFNPKESFKAYKKGNEAEDPFSTISLAFCYYLGFGTIQNINEAKKLWHKNIMEQKDMLGALALALFQYGKPRPVGVVRVIGLCL